MRYTEFKFPNYAHRPGKTTHPNQEGGHSYQKSEPVTEELNAENYRDHEIYLFGLDLYNHQYFWEAHVYWEACWHKVGRKGTVANFLKSLILLSAGRLKDLLNQPEPASTHWLRSVELLESVDSSSFMGIDTDKLKRDIEKLRESSERGETLQHVLELDR